MILPVVAYGDPVLRKVGVEIDKDYEGLADLIDNMFLTMYKSLGVGLAAPQIGKAIRLFIVETKPFSEGDGTEDFTEEQVSNLASFKQVFINPQIVEEKGEPWLFNEGCLSIPDVREDVSRLPTIRIQYYDENFDFHDEEYDGIIARVIQHEFDHIEGKLFIDKISPLRRRLNSRRLKDISKGKVNVTYRMRFPK